MTLTVGSTFTGVGGADLGLEWAGMTIKWQCEIDAWKRQVLAAHWPDVPIYEDICELENPEPVDLLIGGFPCQDLSIAGKRKGFSGERSVLAFEFLRVAESLKPRWLVLENVPGLLNSNKGLDFQRLLREVVACGYGGLAWRCLDARFFAVPQRRRRVFIVARRAETNLSPRDTSGLALRALCEGGSGDLTSCVPPRKDTAEVAEGSVGAGRIFNATAQFGQWVEGDAAGTLSKRDHKSPNHLIASNSNGIGVFRKSRRAQTNEDHETWVEAHAANTLNTFDTGDTRTTHAIVDPTLRRLTPTEYERLMGWPDNHTAPEGVKAPDSRRYAACGDGIVANVAYWIGQRIIQIDKETA